MSRSLRGTLAIVLTLFLTFGPVLRVSADCCGWYSYPVVSHCCDVSEAVDCCGCEPVVMECCEPVIVHEHTSCGCGEDLSAEVEEPQEMEASKPETTTPTPIIDDLPTPQPTLDAEEPVTSDPTPVVEEPAVIEEPATDSSIAPLAVPSGTEDTSVDPIFGPTDDAEEEPVVEETTDSEDSSDDIDDLFPEPEAEESTTGELETMFDESSENETETADETEDFFSAPAEVPTEESEDTDTDDFLGGPEDDAEEMDDAEESAPAEEESSDEDEEDDLFDTDDIFSQVEVPVELQVAGGLESQELRQWTDNTANYHCQARMVGMAPGEVILHKANGKLKHVSLRRLSEQDLQFVYAQVAAHTEYVAKQSSAKKLVSR